LTSPQLFYVPVAAEGPVALAAAEACRKSGFVVRRSMTNGCLWKVGETFSPNSILHVAARKGVPGAQDPGFWAAALFPPAIPRSINSQNIMLVSLVSLGRRPQSSTPTVAS
jgi:hypothetical protein